MEKTVLEKRITGKAEERFDSELRTLAKFLIEHPIGKLLIIRERKLVGYSSEGIFSEHGLRNSGEISNYDKIKTTLIEKYEKEELKNILNKLESVSYLFNQ